MWIPKLNVGFGLDYGLVSRADWYGGNPVIQVVNRDHERKGTNPAVGGCPTRISRRHKFRRSILRKRIVKEISREVVKVITRLPPGPGTVNKIWHHGS